MPSIRQLVIFDLIDDEAVPASDAVQSWDDFIAPFEEKELTFEAMAFDDPLYIMFSSGTTQAYQMHRAFCWRHFDES